MTHAEFRKMQALMDDAGLITCIKAIRTGKKSYKANVKQYDFDDKPTGVILQYTLWRYTYRYEVILNGKIIANVKSRRTAKKRLLALYEEKMAVTSI